MDADLDTLATALYAGTDDLLKAARTGPVAAAGRDRPADHRRRAGHPGGDAGPARLHPSGAGCATPAPTCGTCSRTCPSSPATTSGCASSPTLIAWLIGTLARDTSLWTDDVWVVDSTPVECGRSRETVHRSDLAGWAEYGYCASPLPLLLGPAAAPGVHPARPAGRVRADRRQGRRTRGPAATSSTPTRRWSADRPGQTLIADKNYYGREFEATLADAGHHPAAPGPQGRGSPRPGQQLLQAAAPGHRVDQRHLQRPARPRTPRRPHPRRGRRPRPATHPRPDRRDLAQRPHRRSPSCDH